MAQNDWRPEPCHPKTSQNLVPGFKLDDKLRTHYMCIFIFLRYFLSYHNFKACTTLVHIGKLILRSILAWIEEKTQQEMSVCGGLGFIS